jgi:hypothetical protein
MRIHATRFELWCGFDYAGHDLPGCGPAAVAELEQPDERPPGRPAGGEERVAGQGPLTGRA